MEYSIYRPFSWFLVWLFGLNFFSRGSPNPKRPRFWGFLAICVLLVPSVWAKNACVMPNSQIQLPGYLASKIRFNGFFELNKVVFRTPQVTYARDA